MRVVSLLPSATELICELGLEHQLVGVTHECDYPHSIVGLPVVTRSRIPAGLPSGDIDALVKSQLTDDTALYSLNMPVLEALKPDLIVTQALCDVCAVAADEVNAAACGLPGQPQVINLEPMRLSEVFDTLEALGEAADCRAKARDARAALEARVEAVRERSAIIKQRPRVAMLEWIDPLFNAGHWTPELVAYAGGDECLGNPFEPSTQVSPQALIDAAPDVVFVALCGFDIARSLQDIPLLSKLTGWDTLPAVCNDQVYITDGNAYFSRPGPRLVDSLEILAHTLHPDVHPLPSGLEKPVTPVLRQEQKRAS
ncbi:MAG: cobalamin-binding protein [Pseudomonadota bacterium]